MDFATEPPSPDYYVGLADELDNVVQIVRRSPSLNTRLADRLSELAQQLREDKKAKKRVA